MKFSIGVGQKNYNHVGQLTNSSSCGFGEVQPVFSSVMLPKSTMSVKIAQKVRLMPMPYPTFGHLSLETVGKYVSFGDVFPQLDNLLSGLPYTYQKSNGSSFDKVSALVKSFPWITNDYLQRVLIYPTYADFTIYKDVQPVSVSGTKPSFIPGSGGVPAGSDNAVTIDGADYIVCIPGSTSSKVSYVCYRYNDKGLRLRKIFLGLGYNPSLDDKTACNLLPLLCYYKAYFDQFAPKRFMSFQDTSCFQIVKLFEQYPELFVDDGSFIAGDVMSFAVADTGDFVFNDTIDAFFDEELSMCFATDPTDWVSMHTASLLNNAANYTDVPGDVTSISDSVITTSSSTTVAQVAGVPTLHQGLVGSERYAPSLTSVQLDLLRRITSSVTRDSLVGRSIKKWLENKYGADITNQIYENTITLGHNSLPIQISDVDSNADTFDADTASNNPTGSLIGSYAGKGQGTGNGQFTAKSKSFGLFVVLMWIKPHEDYYQGVDTRLCAKRQDELPQPLYDGIGYELTPRAALWSDNGISVNTSGVAVKGDSSISDSVSFGYAPRYTGFKRYKGVVNGDLSLRSKRESSKSMYLDKQLIFRDIVEQTDLAGKTTYYVDSMNIPRASTEWRYIMKYPWLQNYNRIFYSPGLLTWANGNTSPFPVVDIVGSKPHDDNIIVHSLIQVAESNYLRPLSQSYDTFDVNGTTNIASSGE